jgi:L-alanine-DL-glutamate epimerase-like enolase superfamily enzyme
VDLDISYLGARLRAPFVSARASIGTVDFVLVRLSDRDGAVGAGEGVALDVPVDVLRAAVEDCRSVLAAGGSHDEVIAACARVAVIPQAVAAIDMALWDLAGRRAGQPVWRLLGGDSAPAVDLNATVAVADRAGAAAAAASARAAGFGCVKVKVGIGDDAGRLAAVRAAAGPDMAIRLDANGVWSEAEALSSLSALEPVGIELCEEPVSDLEPLERVSAQTRVAVALDESAVLPGALDRRVCDAVCLKVARCGGISGLVDAARRARAAGYEVYLASTLDGPFGIAAALHAAAVVHPDRPSGLATLPLFEAWADALPITRGVMSPPEGPGLGVDVRP